MSEQRHPNNIPTFELRHRLELAMEAAGLKPEDMAVTLELAPTTIRNYLSGRTRPSKGAVTEWALRCGVDRDWLWKGEASNPGPGQGVSQFPWTKGRRGRKPARVVPVRSLVA